jgi:hypothetical protein
METKTTLFRVDVSQTEKDREYWATRPWISNDASQKLRAADVLIIPWENFREGHPALFPQGTTDFLSSLVHRLPENAFAVAVDQEMFEEIALHARRVRWPTIMVTAVLLPLLVNVLTELAKKLIDEHPHEQSIQMHLLVEGKHGHCIEIDYDGPANDLARTLTEQADKCLPRLRDKPRHLPAGKNDK